MSGNTTQEMNSCACHQFSKRAKAESADPRTDLLTAMDSGVQSIFAQHGRSHTLSRQDAVKVRGLLVYLNILGRLGVGTLFSVLAGRERPYFA
jgi:hypothetical protein